MCHNTLQVPPLIELETVDKSELHSSFLVGLEGPRKVVEICLTERYSNLYEFTGLPRSKAEGEALIDTGAIATSIDKRMAEDLNLELVDRVQVRTAYQSGIVAPMYSFKMTFFGYRFEFLDAPGANLEPHGLVALIGRDILHMGVYNYYGKDGESKFEIPGLSPS